MVSSRLFEARPLEAALRAAVAAQRLTGGRRLLVVSNRGPIEHAFAEDGGVQQKVGCGGVALTLSAIARYAPVTWVAAAMTDADRLAARRNGSDGSQFQDLRLRLVAPNRSAYDAYYHHICNPVLWFLQHGQWELLSKDRGMAEIEEGWDRGYLPVNRAFARRVLDELAEADTAPIVMFQDYHLYVAPAYVRAQMPHATLSHFVHIPWPEPHAWQRLPWRITLSILKGLLACDLVGFQTPESVHNFLLTCYSFVPGARVDFEGHSVTVNDHKTIVRSYPISVDVARLRARMESPAVRRYKMRLAPNGCPYTLVRVDRLDPAKNILLGFKAFDLLLETNPELVERVRFLAFLVPSRQAVPEYRSYKEAVFHIVHDINQRWGSPHWQPIQVFYEHNYDQALAGLALYDVLLVNSLSDGMNLVSKEGALVNERDGVLVLSRAAGAFRELGHAALPTDPSDVSGTADALADALVMPAEERRQRAARLRGAIEANDLSRWLERQLADLDRIAIQRGAAASRDGHRGSNGRRPAAKRASD